ncbi:MULTISPECIES: hypothetical protein [unclassified Tenacibaculum]|uniref:hypothetical protein n=1 Tax=unclassified Tenacibaculum TaxID=2635139 RepID=UPI001F2E0ACC|nr:MULTISPECIES: hypothetical protein [unclassified Tenacibaculum]MCF2873360.1 hypothetical protein [Tenacibaculum sp. Cn5-1]MCF2933516.1 hypothetical protein [Tenacibaculum sp. Cn5-34]MCG7509902.1 hypothetical protein [Tenacibaculum sp. Cn5-46]
MLKYILAWFPMIIIAIANGFFREKLLVNYFDKLQAHQLSSISMIVLLTIYNWILFKIFFPASINQAISIGLIWLLFTIMFEFLFGYYVVGHSWSKLLSDYNILKGRIWFFVLIWISIVPYIIYRIQE